NRRRFDHGLGHRRLDGGGDLAEPRPTRFAHDLTSTLERARVVALPRDVEDLRHEVRGEPLRARVAGDPARLARDLALLQALLGAIEGEAAVALLHLIAELHVERATANAATLADSSHRRLLRRRFSARRATRQRRPVLAPRPYRSTS